MYGHLSTSPGSLLRRDCCSTPTASVDVRRATIPPLGEVGQTKLRRLVFNLSKRGGMAMRAEVARGEAPRAACSSRVRSPRTQAMGDGEACLVSRNIRCTIRWRICATVCRRDRHPARILHPARPVRAVRRSACAQLFVEQRCQRAERLDPRRPPRGQRPLATRRRDMPGGGAVSEPADDARRQRADGAADRRADRRCARDAGGRFFLPYQLHYSREQLVRAYPEIDAFFARQA